MATSGKKRRDDRAVKIRRDLAVKAKLIADSKNVTISEYLSGLLEPHIDKDWPKAVAALEKHDHEPT